VLVTCDDGLLNCLSDMLPILQQESVKCLFFVTGASATDTRSMLWYEELFLLFFNAPAGTVDVSYDGITIQSTLTSREQRRSLWWETVKRLSQVNAPRRASFIHCLSSHFGSKPDPAFGDASSGFCRRYGLLKCAELRQLVSAGMSVGGHTVSHPMLSQLSTELAYREIAESRTRLESALDARVWAFAYPFGDPQSVTPEVLAMPQQAGYQAAFLNFGGGLGRSLPPYSLPRSHVTDAMSLAEFEAHVSGFYARLQLRSVPTGTIQLTA
jgi:peptidoglycan/xylan/chitin deacetylase (PgdA/CDA1 family)